MIVTNSNIGDNPDVAEITITGYMLIGIEIGDYQAGMKRRKQIIFRVNKTNGKIYYTQIKNAN